ncbi:MAG: glycosyltransferase family 2 protein [Verrucomicrobiae bacterium]|nr:glycosyltransferase family 2 protein [Verrucomicrobiae bacterium]
MQDSWSQISLCVITLNEEKNLSDCLASVKGCGEMIVVDSGSTDGTQAIAESFGAKWTVKPWKGFAQQRREAELLASKPFVFFLDADERVSEALHGEISDLLQRPQAEQRLYHMQRQSEFLGRKIRHGDWKRDWVARLAPRGKTEWQGREPHPYLTGKGLKVYYCQNTLKHFPYPDVSVFFKKSDSYARTWAKEAYHSGKRGGQGMGWARAVWRWVRGYLLRGGFLDGRAGWVIAWHNARMVRLKYLFLEELRHKEK